MTSKYQILFLLFIPLLSYAQPDSAKLLLRFNGSYTDYNSSNGTASLGASTSANTDWNIGLAAGFPINQHWEAGVGIDFQVQSATAVSLIAINRLWMAEQHTKTKVHLITGNIYTAYRLNLFNKLYFNPSASIVIGQANGYQNALTAYVEDNISGSMEPIEYNSNSQQFYSKKTNISYGYLAFKCAPAFSFFFNTYMALNLEMGCFQFSVIDGDWEKRQWVANLNPAYWKLGLIVAF